MMKNWWKNVWQIHPELQHVRLIFAVGEYSLAEIAIPTEFLFYIQ